MGQAPGDLVLVSFPHQVMHAVGALRMERLRRGIEFDDPFVVLVWSYEPCEHLPRSRFRSLLPQMLAGLPGAVLSFPSYRTRRFTLSSHRSVAQRARYLGRNFVRGPLRLVAYSHDVGADHTAQALLQAARPASAVCFGDPPGFLYTREEVLRSAEYKASLMRAMFFNGQRADAGIHWRFADVNWVAVEFAGAGYAGAEPAVPTGTIAPEVLMQTLRQLSEGIEWRGALQDEILASMGAGTEVHLLLLSNFTESRITGRDRELALYVELIRRHAAPGGVVLVKPHAGTKPSFVRRLARSLPDYRMQILPPAIGALPVEMLDKLLARCRVISVSSASALLSSLFSGGELVHGLTDELIQRYFSSAWTERFKASNRLILDAMEFALASRCL